MLEEHAALVCVMALGIVVRLVAPLARHKELDPAVVVVDEAGRFAISVLGGHAAGGNDLARSVAAVLGATPVITTASDALGLPAVDLIGHPFGWELERREDLTGVAAAVIARRAVGVYQDAGRPDWWREFGPWPEHFERVQDPSQLDARFAAAIVISDRDCDTIRAPRVPTATFRPRTLCVGVGCCRGARLAELEELFGRVFREQRLAARSVCTVATAWLKADEPAVREFAERLGVPLRTFSSQELQSAGPLPTPSAAVRARTGLDGVAEPAAMLAARNRTLLVTKQTSRSVTMAVARQDDQA